MHLLRLCDYDCKIRVIPPPSKSASGTTSRTAAAAILFVPGVDSADYGHVLNLLHGESLAKAGNIKLQLVLHYVPEQGRSFRDVVAQFYAEQVRVPPCAVHPLVPACLGTCPG